jgi:hypothetical protein
MGSPSAWADALFSQAGSEEKKEFKRAQSPYVTQEELKALAG